MAFSAQELIDIIEAGGNLSISSRIIENTYFFEQVFKAAAKNKRTILIRVESLMYPNAIKKIAALAPGLITFELMPEPWQH